MAIRYPSIVMRSLCSNLDIALTAMLVPSFSREIFFTRLRSQSSSMLSKITLFSHNFGPVSWNCDHNVTKVTEKPITQINLHYILITFPINLTTTATSLCVKKICIGINWTNLQSNNSHNYKGNGWDALLWSGGQAHDQTIWKLFTNTS